MTHRWLVLLGASIGLGAIAFFALGGVSSCASHSASPRLQQDGLAGGSDPSGSATPPSAHPTPSAAFSSPQSTAPVHRSGKPIVGFNLDFPGDWSDLVPFLDLMHDARTWKGGGRNDGVADLDLDEHGWPKSMGGYTTIGAIFRAKTAPDYVDHEWVLTYKGKGELAVRGAVRSVDARPGKISFIGKSGNAWLEVRSTDPRGTGDYVRDIQIVRRDWLERHARGELFNPALLEFLKPFGSLRFMDWMRSNQRTQDLGGTWAAQSKMAQPQWLVQFIDPTVPSRGFTATGYPPEVMVALANAANAHPHFNMPYKFDEDYVRNFAKVVREKLAPGLIATIEYSNEVWNSGFRQSRYARNEAEKLWRGEKTGGLQFMGVRAAEMCRVWKQVFEGQHSRIRCVIAPQTGWPEIATASLDCPDWVAMGHEPCHTHVDAIAITGYFSGLLPKQENTALIKQWLAEGKAPALDKAFRQLRFGDVPGIHKGKKLATSDEASSLTNALEKFDVFAQLAAQRDLGLYVYEGGTHFDHGKDDVMREFLGDVASDPRMKNLYVELLRGFAKAGGTVFNLWGGVGDSPTWAIAPSLYDTSHPKYAAVVELGSGLTSSQSAE